MSSRYRALIMAIIIIIATIIMLEWGIPAGKKRFLPSEANLSIDPSIKKSVDFLFQTTIELSDKQGQRPVFLPKYQTLPVDDMLDLADKFSMTLLLDENEKIIFSNEWGRLTMYRYIQRLFFEKDANPVEGYDLIDEAAAVAIAKKFFSDYELDLPTQSVVVTDEIFIIYFIDQVGEKDIKYDNWAFPTTIKISPQGHVLQFDYYYFDYEKFTNCSIISEIEAFYQLPTDHNQYYSIKYVKLVYTMKDSILQPMYHFLATDENSELAIFQIDAAVFE